jgi:hypothetical protein
LRRQISLIVVVMIFLMLIACLAGCSTPNGPSGQVDVSTVKNTPSAQKTAPEEAIPANIPGFELQLTSEPQEGIFEGEEYLVVGFFKPLPNTTYDGKVEFLTINVDKFVNETSVMAGYSEYTGADMTVSGHPGKYRYDPENGIASLVTTLGPLMIESVAQAPENATPFDENILKQAVVVGTGAAVK